MRILMACEFSGRARDAFIKKGHDAISCDLYPSETPGPHYQGNVMDILYEKWDMVIAFPPCTYLTGAGNAWFNVSKYGAERVYARYHLRVLAIEFFMRFVDHPCPRIAIENPPGVISAVYRKPNQWFCHTDHGSLMPKKTGLWLKGLPPLMATKRMDRDKPYRRRKTTGRWNSPSIDDTLHLPAEERRKARSRLPVGVARAFADQWGRNETIPPLK